MSTKLGDGTITFGDGSTQDRSITTFYSNISTVAINVVNTNSTGYPMHVYAAGASAAADNVNHDMYGYVNDTQVCSAFVVNDGGHWESRCSMSFFVPAGATYKITNAGGLVNIYYTSVQY